jgi:glycine/D-amino acid oxidase-like deaminating enzyme/nitrite reductase/ring-hydroxylating ferredoxin subunit
MSKVAVGKPYWDDVALPEFPKVAEPLDVDVAVVGAGLTGTTAALLLQEAGCRVALIERGRVGGIDTGCTTAHITPVTDARLAELASKFGKERARAVWEAGWSALQQIHDIADSNDIDCEFTWVPGFFHVSAGTEGAQFDKAVDIIKEEVELANELGFDAEYLERIPVVGTPGMRVDHQATFHPRRYLRGVLELLKQRGAEIFEQSEVVVEDDKAHAGGHEVRAKWIVLATHTPLQGRQSILRALTLQTKLALYTSYVVRARLEESVNPALFWDTADPYNYARIDRVDEQTYIIAGGADHKTGQTDDPEAGYRAVQAWLARFGGEATVTHRWSGQVLETPDGLPIIGPVANHQFVATGYAGNGMTFGTLAAMMARDAVIGRVNPWTDLFAADRSVLLRAPFAYLIENVDYPYYLVRDRVAGRHTRPLRALSRNSGDIVTVDGTTVAAYRDSHGKLTTLNPTCTHLGCRVRWNRTDKVWDCPCHGSRFQPTGEVLAGPAESPLQPVSLGPEH